MKSLADKTKEKISGAQNQISQKKLHQTDQSQGFPGNMPSLFTEKKSQKKQDEKTGPTGRKHNIKHESLPFYFFFKMAEFFFCPIIKSKINSSE
jgi:hypothetical protein